MAIVVSSWAALQGSRIRDVSAYAASKAAIRELTTSLAAELGPRGITVNCVNPGPVDTGYAFGERHAAAARAHPQGRWGTPADIVPTLRFLASAESGWLTGQTIDVDGGWSVRDGT